MQRSDNFSWDDYRILLAVADGGSFVHAGRALGVATSTAARRVAAWERRLGTRLVDRRSSGVLLTEAGLTLTKVARTLQEHVSSAEHTLADRDEVERGKVRITVGDGMGDGVVFLLPELRGLHPGIELELIADARTYDLSKRQADLALRAVRPAGAGLLVRKVGAFRLGLYASRAYLGQRGKPTRLRDLARHDIVGLSAALANNPAQRWLTELGVEQVWFRGNSVALALRALEAGLGIGAVAHPLAVGLERVLPNLETPPHPLWLVRHKDTRGQRRIDIVVEYLDRKLREAT